MAKQPTTTNLSAYKPTDYSEMLHSPREPLQNLEDHLFKSASLSRALWNATQCVIENGDDERDAYALWSLASEVAHHASAANKLWHEECERRSAD